MLIRKENFGGQAHDCTDQPENNNSQSFSLYAISYTLSAHFSEMILGLKEVSNNILFRAEHSVVAHSCHLEQPRITTAPIIFVFGSVYYHCKRNHWHNFRIPYFTDLFLNYNIVLPILALVYFYTKVIINQSNNFITSILGFQKIQHFFD